MDIFTSNDQTGLTGEKRSLLRAVLDTLLPPNGPLPGAGTLGLDEQIEREGITMPGYAQAMHTVLDALPSTFLTAQSDGREGMLREIEAHVSEPFSILVLMAYNAYYTDQRVLDQIERELGYEARPPQPLGYRLKPFDERSLAQMRSREPFWRQVPEEPPSRDV